MTDDHDEVDDDPLTPEQAQRAVRAALRDAQDAITDAFGGDLGAVHYANLQVSRAVKLVMEHRLDLAQTTATTGGGACTG